MTTFGPTFGDELAAAGLGGLPIGWTASGSVSGREYLTDDQNTALDAVIAAHDPTKELVPLISLYKIQTRMKAEGVWDIYVNYMFSANARRNAFLEIIFLAQPLKQDNAGIRTTMTAAGISAAAIERILAANGNGG